MSAPAMRKPDWANDDGGWHDLPRIPEPRVVTSKGSIVTIIGLAVALVATLALAIVATFDSERAFADVYTRWQLAEARIDGLTGENLRLAAERDLANEAWSQCSGRPVA